MSSPTSNTGAYGAERRDVEPVKVDDFHQQSDADARSESQHHTLGPKQTQASPGNHTHDGGLSPLLWAGSTIVGSRGGNQALAGVIAVLVQKGAVDSTTA